MKAFLDDKINVYEKLKSIQTLYEKEKKVYFSGLFKVGCVWYRVNKKKSTKLLLTLYQRTNFYTGLNLQTPKVTEKLKFVFGRVENIVGKGENAGYQHFLVFPQCFLKVSFSRSLKVGIV